MPGERNSVEPMAAVVSAACVSVQHQLLLRFVGPAPWSDEAVLSKVRGLALPAIEGPGPIEAWIVDDTRFIKRDVHSVSVARQYCCRLGKIDNCQIALTLSVVKHSIFRVNNREAAGGTGMTQFGRALDELNIDIICANTPQAKGRVERAFGTLQDRLVKELRLANIVDIEGGNALPKARRAAKRRVWF